MKKIILAAAFAATFAQNASADYVKISDDLTMHYETSGHGEQVVLLVPGGGMSGAVFEKQLDHFKSSNEYKLIVIDPRSQGLSTHTSDGNFYEQHGRDLANFIKVMKLHQIVLGGWSYGGFDVLSYVHQSGSANLRGFIMIDTVPKFAGKDVSPSSREWIWHKKEDVYEDNKYYIQGSLMNRHTVNDEFAKYMVDDATPSYLTWISKIMDQTSDETFAITIVSASYQNYESDLKSLEGKVGLMYYVGPSIGQRAKNWSADNTPSAQLTVFGKHLSFWEHPEVFNSALDTFLSNLPSKKAVAE
jgi:pimeloyl-ACP methyl ester carboxylesterase